MVESLTIILPFQHVGTVQIKIGSSALAFVAFTPVIFKSFSGPKSKSSPLFLKANPHCINTLLPIITSCLISRKILTRVRSSMVFPIWMLTYDSPAVSRVRPSRVVGLVFADILCRFVVSVKLAFMQVKALPLSMRAWQFALAPVFGLITVTETHGCRFFESPCFNNCFLKILAISLDYFLSRLRHSPFQ